MPVPTIGVRIGRHQGTALDVRLRNADEHHADVRRQLIEGSIKRRVLEEKTEGIGFILRQVADCPLLKGSVYLVDMGAIQNSVIVSDRSTRCTKSTDDSAAIVLERRPEIRFEYDVIKLSR